MKLKKIDKEFLLTDEAVNCYGFRLLTSGYLIDEYKKNPIGYYMHERAAGVVLRWEDFRIDKDKVFAKPVINLSHPRAQQTIDEIENGFLNGASVGHFVILETSEDAALKLPGQTGPTVTKWYNRETSLVDIPGNFNSLALYDAEGNTINLSDFTQQKISMKQIFLSPAHLTALNLKAEATQAEVDTTIADLIAKAQKVDTLQQQLNDANTEKTKAVNDLAALKKTTTENEVKALVDTALDAKKITKQLADTLAADYKENPTGLKALLDAMPAYTPIAQQLQGAEKEVQDLVAKGWDKLDKENQLENLKAKSLDEFKKLYKEKFGKEYAG